jgi:hypothetical protein
MEPTMRTGECDIKGFLRVFLETSLKKKARRKARRAILAM